MTKTKTVIAAGAVLCAGIMLTGCGLRTIASPTKEQTKAYDVGGAVAAIDVESGSGAIVVVGSGRTGIRVTESMHWKGEQPKTKHPMDGDTLKLSYDCEPDDWNCGVDYRVELPAGTRVKVKTGSGDITLRALGGEVRATTGSGEIDANDLSGKHAVAETGSGDVELRFTVVPDDVQVSTGSGTGVVRVPAGNYNVTTNTGSGDKTVGVAADASSPHRIIVKTGSGDAKVLKA
ncbi:DUF4097 family beta strand repeat-containing protein [Sphaerisporangium sp. B11E5]|uniref:DUF4097 family beta strand repeat-containing protein n=1 Tax=Sphaerisporangium sp. B11E5 TaxID=3153563 RepID=UPI00325D512D